MPLPNHANPFIGLLLVESSVIVIFYMIFLMFYAVIIFKKKIFQFRENEAIDLPI